MKGKQIPYIDQLFQLAKLYKIDEIKVYAKSKKQLTTSQLELILLKNKIRLPEQSYNKKKIAEIKFKEQVTTNILITLCLIAFMVSIISVRPFIKSFTSDIKFTYVAKEYKSNFKKNSFDGQTKALTKSSEKDKDSEDYISLDTQVTLNIFENSAKLPFN